MPHTPFFRLRVVLATLAPGADCAGIARHFALPYPQVMFWQAEFCHWVSHLSRRGQV